MSVVICVLCVCGLTSVLKTFCNKEQDKNVPSLRPEQGVGRVPARRQRDVHAHPGDPQPRHVLHQPPGEARGGRQQRLHRRVHGPPLQLRQGHGVQRRRQAGELSRIKLLPLKQKSFSCVAYPEFISES